MGNLLINFTPVFLMEIREEISPILHLTAYV